MHDILVLGLKKDQVSNILNIENDIASLNEFAFELGLDGNTLVDSNLPESGCSSCRISQSTFDKSKFRFFIIRRISNDF